MVKIISIESIAPVRAHVWMKASVNESVIRIRKQRDEFEPGIIISEHQEVVARKELKTHYGIIVSWVDFILLLFGFNGLEIRAKTKMVPIV